jgi:hypothetical protein
MIIEMTEMSRRFRVRLLLPAILPEKIDGLWRKTRNTAHRLPFSVRSSELTVTFTPKYPPRQKRLTAGRVFFGGLLRGDGEAREIPEPFSNQQVS